MEITIQRALPEDAPDILELSKVLGNETDNLTFGEEGISMSVEKEMEYLSSISNSEKAIFLVARTDGELAGTASYTSFSQKRMSHRGEIGISIRKSAWGLGIGSMLIEKLLDFAQNTANAEIVSLEVRSDNDRAINLYKKFGFKKIGQFKGFFKIHNEMIDFDIMEKFF